MKNELKIPKFKNEDEEREFWSNTSLDKYFDAKDFQKASFPNLKPSVKSISLRLSLGMLNNLKMISKKKDIPYQSYIKMVLDERINKELAR
ncbi:MAG: BrnA antitoxin family protein [Patescibacteria group bacterium]|nr:BrnA antitoxin family protein [Patescibacteria group bacterium]